MDLRPEHGAASVASNYSGTRRRSCHGNDTSAHSMIREGLLSTMHRKQMWASLHWWKRRVLCIVFGATVSISGAFQIHLQLWATILPVFLLYCWPWWEPRDFSSFNRAPVVSVCLNQHPLEQQSQGCSGTFRNRDFCARKTQKWTWRAHLTYCWQ